MGWQPYSIHTTFQYGGAPGKRHRLREAGYPETLDPYPNPNPDPDPDLDPHPHPHGRTLTLEP